MTSRWTASTSAWVNSGLAIQPPSINVATFDGIDSLGKPYSVNDVLAKGFADKLESQPIDLLAVPTSSRASVYFSFYYQLRGRGEAPELGDRLILEFLNKDKKWEQIWTRENDGTLSPDVFNQVILPITEDRFFHAGFRFRFKNFARLSGPYDSWHLDYIYLNDGRTAGDTSYPDRSVVSTLTSIFGVVRAMPKAHFFAAGNAVLTKPSFIIHNLRVGNDQPVNYFSFAQVSKFSGGVETKLPNKLLDSAASIGSVKGLEFRTVQANNTGLLGLLDPTSDSLRIRLKLGLSSGDNIVPAPNVAGDYDSAKFAPIDFRHNDTLRAEYWLSSYYAYDDGGAEYGAGLNQPGSQVAYQFDLAGVEDATVTHLQMYFPRFGDETSQVIELRIWNDLSEDVNSLLYKEVVTLQRNELNNFWIKKLNKAVAVKKTFYVGWRQTSAAVIAVGLDKNNDTGDRISFNINGTWQQNKLVVGSLMIRPVIGAPVQPGPDPVDGVEEVLTTSWAPYPNPSEGTFNIPASAEDISLSDISGRSIDFTASPMADRTEVAITRPSPGLYIIRMNVLGQRRACKIMVR